jgi:type IV secretory pathway TraG/TraD family ATPase VirD4
MPRHDHSAIGSQRQISGGFWLGFHDRYLRAKLFIKALLGIGLTVGGLHVTLAWVGWFLWAPDHFTALWQEMLQDFAAHELPRLDRIGSSFSAACGSYYAALVWANPVWLLALVLICAAAWRSRQLRTRTHLRGSRLDHKPKLPKRRSAQQGLALGEVWLTRQDEIRHTLCVGRPGVGKTVLMQSVLEQLLAREEDAKILIYDFKGDYVSTFLQDGDELFNPLDRRSVRWNIFSDIRDILDIDAICQSLIPESHDQERFWIDSARAVLSGILHRCWHDRTRTNAAVWGWLTRDTKELADALAAIPQGQRGWKAIENPSSPQALGVMATLMNYAKTFEAMARWEGGWSAREWATLPGRRVLYIANTSQVKDTLKPILSLCIDLLGRTLLSLPDQLDRRLYFIIDEFGTLQRLSMIAELLTLSRSKGGSVWLGIQDLGQIERLYHRELKQTLINACGNTAVFALADPDTQQYVSNLIGQAEYEDPDLHQTIADQHAGGFQMRRQEKTAPLVMPSELQSLPDLSCLIRTNSSCGVWSQTRIPYCRREPRRAAFEPLPELTLPDGAEESNADVTNDLIRESR